MIVSAFSKRDLWRRELIWPGVRAELPTIIFSGAVNAVSHALLFQSFLYINKAAATIIYEVWPILVVLMIQRLVVGVYQQPRLGDYLLGVMAFAGLAIVTVSQPEMVGALQAGSGAPGADMFSADLTLGFACALASAVCMALSSALDVKINRRFALAMPFTISPIFAQALIKVPSTLAALLLFAVLAQASGEQSGDLAARVAALDAEAWRLVIIAGVGIIALGAVSYHWANAATASPMINVLWYLTPVLSLIWFAQLGLAEITPAIAVGAILIISANLLLSVRAENSAAYAATIVALALSAAPPSWPSGPTKTRPE